MEEVLNSLSDGKEPEESLVNFEPRNWLWILVRFNSSRSSLINSSCFGLQIANIPRASWCGLAFTESCSYSFSPISTSKATALSRKDWKNRKMLQRMERSIPATTARKWWVALGISAWLMCLLIHSDRARNFLTLTLMSQLNLRFARKHAEGLIDVCLQAISDRHWRRV